MSHFALISMKVANADLWDLYGTNILKFKLMFLCFEEFLKKYFFFYWNRSCRLLGKLGKPNLCMEQEAQIVLKRIESLNEEQMCCLMKKRPRRRRKKLKTPKANLPETSDQIEGTMLWSWRRGCHKEDQIFVLPEKWEHKTFGAGA